MKINPREKKLVVVTVAVAAAFVVYQAAVKPLSNWRVRLAGQVAELEGQLARYQASLRQQTAVEEQFRAMAVDLRQKASNEEEIARLLLELRKKYSAFPLADKGTQPLKPEEEPGVYRKFRISLKLEGTMLALADFLYSISITPEPLKVEQLELRAVGGEAGAETVQASIVVSAVYTI